MIYQMNYHRLFPDDISLFFVVQDTNLPANALNNDLLKIVNWTYQWKMSFNPDQEVIFSCKIKRPSHPVLIFKNNQVIQSRYQKHLALFSDKKLNIGEHSRYIPNKVNTSTGNFKNIYRDDH